MKRKLDPNHKWSFFKAGGVYQAEIESGDDIAGIASLDQTLWAALACPTRGVHFDQKTLDMLDADGDGRIRSPEIIAACEWVCGLLKDPDKLVKSPSALLLEDIDDSSPEGAALLSSAAEVLKNLGKGRAEGLAPADFDDETKIFANSVFNADGVVTEDASADESVKDAMRTIASVMGTSPDRSGKEGISQASADGFYERLAGYGAWRAKSGPATLPFGDATESLYSAFSAVERKIDEYFELSRVISYDPASESSINPTADRFEKIIGSPEAEAELAALPLARVRAGSQLDLYADINPAWKDAFLKFKGEVLPRVAPESETLSEDAWKGVKARFRPYSDWLAQKDDRGMSAIAPEALENASKPEVRAALEDLFAKDWAIKSEVENIAKLAKLVRLNSNLYELLTNFVSFKAFYKRDGKAMFQRGRLFFDQRECDLCIKVEDAAKHATLSPMSYLYLIYCTCTREGEAPISIAAAITEGDADNIQAGRNGLFYDRRGRDWDATVTKVVSNPISITQAFWSPYKRFVNWISEQIAKRAAAADTTVASKLTSGVETAANAANADPKAPKKIDVGTVAALGVAVGGITAAFGVVMGALKGMDAWQFPLIIVGLVLLISLPSMVIAAIKLNQRNLGPLLDANMWAVNTRAKLNFKLGATLTRPAKVPLGSRTGKDPFEQKRPYAKIFLCAILLAAAALGALEYRYSWIRRGIAEIRGGEQSSQTPGTDAKQAAASEKPQTGQTQK